MVDEHIWGEVGRISPEAPVIVVDAQDFECRPGGAANVVNNVRALGAQASVIGIVGDDEHGRKLIDILSSTGVDVSGMVIDPLRPTTRKTRIWASHRQQVVRVDWESRNPVPTELSEKIRRHIQREMELCDAIILSDYNKGMLIPDVVSAAIEGALTSNKVCTCNAKPDKVHYFAHVTALTLNLAEAEAVLGRRLTDEASISDGGCALLKQLAPSNLVITRGSRGLALFERGSKVTYVPGMPIEVYDVAGAGDTVISTLTLALASNVTPVDAAKLANAAGGAVVRKVGVATTTPEEIAQLLDGQSLEKND